MSQSIQYIALLRGINVGGHQVKMEKLRSLFASIGFENVRSYIQTGNIFFECNDTDKQSLRQEIETHLDQSLGFKVPVCLRTTEELEAIVNSDPFCRIPLRDDMRFAVTFLTEPIKEKIVTPSKTPDGAYELIAMTAVELFVVWHLKNGRPGSSYGSFEKKMNVQGTTRFWHTTAKILAAAQQVKK